MSTFERRWLKGASREWPAVIRKGRIEKIGVCGKASIEFDLPVATSTPFAVASISKSFTAVAILTLVEAGKLRLDNPVSSHLRDLPPAWQSVTVRQLLNHTSGLPDVNVNDYATATIANTTLKRCGCYAIGP
jgi:CubicO group peptidase (beta-lactamase class C family)